ncbi:MAG: DUF3039 domain-containing protein [Micrococcales bacterium]|nr:DUF3039 domain-containing protein [Micrococcales bacterium]MCL2666739.1 DUF3039 domain-containing protein [Micrococcales bacterium]
MTFEAMADPGPDDPRGPISPSGPDTATSVLERTETAEELEPGDRERFAHYVRKEKILESAVSGKPVIALCGKVWVPGRDPSKFPVCPACRAILDGMRGGDNNDDNDSGSGRRWGFGRDK